ncbi:MAG: GerW family sporulation protein [Hyphomonadaceae bacterium]|nr:GerW family sporulation protein [Clostridia bacterium]
MGHPIEGLMSSVMQNIKEMIDVNTIVGDAVETPEGTVIIPISKVSFGFAAGGSEFGDASSNISGQSLPFGGGSGAGISIQPVAFMVVGKDGVKLLPVNHNSPLEKVLDLVPDIVDKINHAVKEKMHNGSKSAHSEKSEHDRDSKDIKDSRESKE